MSRPSSIALPLLVCATILSCARPLDKTGSVIAAVQTIDEGLKAAADSSGIKLEQRADPRSWYPRLLEESKSGLTASLYAADWGRELFSLAKEGGLEDGSSAWKRSAFSRVEPAWLKRLPAGPEAGFVPISAYVWGLFFNDRRLAELGASQPSTIAELEALFAKARSAGYAPVALGTAFGWPGAAWFTMLDLRMNGAAAVRERLAGARAWDDEGGRAVADRLAAWRELGFFSAEAPKLGMAEALASVEAGESLCVLTGSYSVERFARPAELRFLPFPAEKAGGARAEIAGLSGYAIPKEAGEDSSAEDRRLRLESALALLDAYLESGETGRKDGYRVPLAYASRRKPPKGGDPLPSLEGIRATQAEMLRSAEDLVPAFDRVASPQALQNSIALWTAFFGPGGIKGGELAEALQGAMELGR